MRPGFVVAVGAVSACRVATAQFDTYTGPGGPINDFTGQRFTIFVSQHGNATVEFVTLDISHTWAGDLYIEVRHKTPADYACILMNRPGVPQSRWGNSDDLDGVYTFKDGFTPIPETVGATGFIVPGMYGPHAGQMIRQVVSDSFGEWSLYISDDGGGDVGVLRSWSLTLLDLAPAPSSLGILGIGALVMARRKR